jgi:hypothetical protein
VDATASACERRSQGGIAPRDRKRTLVQLFEDVNLQLFEDVDRMVYDITSKPPGRRGRSSGSEGSGGFVVVRVELLNPSWRGFT